MPGLCPGNLAWQLGYFLWSRLLSHLLLLPTSADNNSTSPFWSLSHHYPCSVPERHDHLHRRWLTPTQSHQLEGFETEGRPDQHSSQNQAVENLGQPPAMIPSDYVETGSGAPPLGRMGLGERLCLCPSYSVFALSRWNSRHPHPSPPPLPKQM